jgi:O-antigen/teichoic acid export membrane protein
LKVLEYLVTSNETTIRIARNLSVAAISGVVSRFIALATTAYIARYLGVAQLGQIGFAEGIFAFIILLSDLGLQTIGMREIAKSRNDFSVITTIVNSVVSIQFVLVSVWYFLAVAFTWVWMPDSVTVWWLIPVYGVCVLYPFLPTLEWWLNAIEKLHVTALLRIIREILFLICIFLLANLNISLLSVPLALAISTVVVAIYINYIYYLSYQRGLKFYFDRWFWKMLLKSSIPVGLTNLLNQISVRSGFVLLGIYSNNLELGFFTAAWKLFYVGLEIQSLINIAVYPVMARLYISNYRGFYKVRQQFLVSTIFIGLCLFLSAIFFASQITAIVFGQGYETSGTVLQLLGIGLSFVFLSTSFAITLLVSHNERVLIVPSALGAAINIVLTVILTPGYGATGAALAYMLSALATSILLVLFYYTSSKTLITP